MRLSELQPGQIGVITKILGHGAFRKRVMEIGFVKGRKVKMVLNAPLQDPIKYALMDYEVSLRKSEADLLEIVPLEEWDNVAINSDTLTLNHDDDHLDNFRKDKIINVVLLGNPNCGKTSLFNYLSGHNEHVGNYAGVTIDAKAAKFKYKDYKFNIVDLPGTYSLSAYSPEEKYVMNYLREATPDIIVNVVVASNLERNLYLTTELIDMNRSMVIDLNMYDELEKSGVKFDYRQLGKMLGVPVVPTVAATGQGVNNLLDTIIDVFEMRCKDTRHIHVKMSSEIESGINQLKNEFKKDLSISHHFSPRFLAIKFIEKDPEIENILKHNVNYNNWLTIREDVCNRIKKTLNEDASTAIASEKYGFINGALKETMEGSVAKEEKATKIIDTFVTNRLFGFPIFLCVMCLMFWSTFKLGSYPMEWIEQFVSWISSVLETHLSAGPLKDLLIEGIIGGVGGVIVFLPNILILYLFISFMEESGYMARVAFITDKIMHKMGLHGKSFIPLVMGFGCNVPAVMSTRIIESKSSRIITILINPFISCSARIPIYVLLVGAFFPNYGTLVFLGLYLLGLAVAVITAKMMRRYWFKEDETPFVMELPPYRMPTWRTTVRNMWSKAYQYLQKMGGLILVASIIIWALSYFPHFGKNDVPEKFKTEMTQYLPEETVKNMNPEKLDNMVLSEYQQSHSILGRIGKSVQPIMEPMEFGWRSCVALIAGASAKEVVVSTLGVLYVGDDDSKLLSQRLKTPSPTTGKQPFTEASALAFMVFVLLYFPCIATLTAIAKETGSWKYALFSILYNTGIAWILSFIVFNIARLI